MAFDETDDAALAQAPADQDPATSDLVPGELRQAPLPGRGTQLNVPNRFATSHIEPVDDGWWQDENPSKIQTVTIVDDGRSIISRNSSPDIPFDYSINPYRGCEHGCIYCYARPTHAYWDMSPGLDFETRIVVKPRAAQLLQEAFEKPGYQCRVISIGANTDPYQPLERTYKTTRQLLEVLSRYRHPFTLITKSALILRDLDILGEMAGANLCSVAVSVTSLDDNLKRRLEPRTASGSRRLSVIEALSAAGVPTTVMVAPVIPALNDSELESILKGARDAGARHAGYILLRLPLEVKPLFEAWLGDHYPDRAAHVMSIVRQSRGGAAYQAEFGLRMRGDGVFATLLQKRFDLAVRRLGMNQSKAAPGLDTGQFCRRQRELF